MYSRPGFMSGYDLCWRATVRDSSRSPYENLDQALTFAASARAMPTVPIQISKRVEGTLAIDL